MSYFWWGRAAEEIWNLVILGSDRVSKTRPSAVSEWPRREQAGRQLITSTCASSSNWCARSCRPVWFPVPPAYQRSVITRGFYSLRPAVQVRVMIEWSTSPWTQQSWLAARPQGGSRDWARRARPRNLCRTKPTAAFPERNLGGFHPYSRCPWKTDSKSSQPGSCRRKVQVLLRGTSPFDCGDFGRNLVTWRGAATPWWPGIQWLPSLGSHRWPGRTCAVSPSVATSRISQEGLRNNEQVWGSTPSESYLRFFELDRLFACFMACHFDSITP